MRSDTIYKSLIVAFVLLSVAGPVLANPWTEGLVPRDPGGSGRICNASSICTICDAWHLADHIIGFLLEGLAIPMLTITLLWGGTLWVTSRGNASQITKGKTILSTALTGLVIALGAWLFVDTIIKTLASGNIKGAWNKFPTCANVSTLASQTTPIVAATLPGGTEAPPGEQQPQQPQIEGTVSNAQGYQLLQDAGISVVSTGSCSDQTNSSCTSLEQMPSLVITKLIEIKGQTGVDLKVTGGTEVGHQTHGPGLPVVDFKPESGTSEDYKKLLQAATAAGGSGFCETKQGKNDSTCTPSGIDPTDHIHMRF